MLHDSSPEPDPDDSDTEYIEVDPSGRYGRYKEVLGRGAFKKVYRGFDAFEGIEVAWNQIKVADLLRNSKDMDRLYSEVHLLKTLKHKNIMKFHHSWVDTENKNINFLTEIFTSGTLRQYRKKHKRVDLRAVKKWSKQILEGLFYLHSHDPPVIHRDLKCDNIFVNGNNGEVKIGDLGLAAILGKARSAHSVIGTPEFMAPELYEEDYNELVDIYAFGMCLLELVTFEYPYDECANAAQIYKKVTSGIKPASLAKVNDPGVKAFIEKCIAKVSDRLSARELLMDPFLRSDEHTDTEVISQSLPPYLDAAESKDVVPEGSRDFTVQGQRKGPNIIILKLRIADSTGHIRNIHFPFDTEVDTALTVASEMVEQLDLITDQDVSAIAEMIASEIHSYIPDWAPKELSQDKANIEVAVSDISAFDSNKDVSPSKNEFFSPFGNLKPERLPSGRKYWSNSPIKAGGNSPDNPGPSNLYLERSWAGENEGGSNNVASLEQMEDEHGVDVNKKKKQVRVNADLQFDESNSDTNPHQLGHNSRTVNDIDSNDVRIVAEKLGHLLVEQAKEMDELKRRNEQAVSDLLKELSPETHHIVLRVCSQRIDDHKLWCQMECCTGNSTD